ncbi:MAG: cation:proton antiporter [Candidatus Caenarcaniphilales bacterium]|nr:cation:proton antiporter [Candidatus Caenarcaniphilales bacterium]
MVETLEPIIVLLGCGIASVLLLPRFGISPIVGFLVSGICLGHHGFQLIPNNETIHLMAELGVVFLLFDIGLHFSLRHVWNERKGIFVFGPLQVFITSVIFYFIGMQLGLANHINILLSLALSLSSTAVVSQVIADKGLQGTPNSNTTIAILIFQDICAIFLLILADTLGNNSETSLWTEVSIALLKCIGSFLAVVLVGKYLLKPLFQSLIKYNNSEVFTMIALFLVLLTGAATGSIGLSLSLGAFLAGMIISETPFKYIIQTELRPFRFLLLSFFFMTVGSSIDARVLLTDWFSVILTTSTIVIVKAMTVFFLFLAFKERLCNTIQQSAILFQGSEFLFVIIAVPAISTNLGTNAVSVLIASVAISMALTSFIFNLAQNLAMKVVSDSSSKDNDKGINYSPRLVIIGMNDIGHTLARAMQHFKVPYLSVERDYQNFLKARLEGYPTIYGDKADIRFWENLGIERFQYLVIAQPDIEVSRMYAPIVKERLPHLIRYVASRNEQECNEYKKLGNIPVISLGVPSGLELSERVLSDLGLKSEDIEKWISKEQKSYLDRKYKLTKPELAVK